MIKRIISSIWFLGLLIAIPAILALPELFDKYKAKLILQEKAAQPTDYRIYFRDLDRNGLQQKIYGFPNSAKQLAFQYFGEKGGMINQINFKHRFANNVPFIFFGDANKNGFRELYGFTLNQDSLFLNWAEVVNPQSKGSQMVYITRVGTVENTQFDFSISRFAVMDLDNDRDNEIVFSIIAGHSKYPRNLVIYHPESGRLLTSEDIQINPYSVTFYDINSDGKIEILAGSNAGYNLVDSVTNLVIDNRPYLMAYDSELNPLWDPIPFSQGIDNSLQVLINDPNLMEILVFQFNKSRPNEKIIGIYRLDFKGNVKDSVFLGKYGKRFNFQVFPDRENFWIYTGDKMVSLDKQLNVIKEKKLENSAIMYRTEFLVNGTPEVATKDLHKEKACIYTENFNHKVILRYPDEEISHILFNVSEDQNAFMVQTTTNEYTYRLVRNWIYYFKYPGYLLIYFLSVLFVWLIQNIRERQLKEKFELQTQLRDLEIKYLRMQMDPHFMFNIFNSVALLLKNGAKDEAFDSFMKFTRVVRSNFDFSDRFTRPLTEEVDIVRQYLELNKLRFKEKLEFRISMAKDLPPNILIPKMMMQIHVENALKHGLAKLERTGVIDIQIIREKEEIVVTIEDNGIGRQKAAYLNPGSTKQGLKMLSAMYDRLNLQSKSKITQVIEDKSDENQNPAGTKVIIRLPVSLKEVTAT